MNITETTLPGVLLITQKVFGDARGFFVESYRAEALLARELFETPIDAATRIQYRLVGPWDDPQFIPQDIDTPSEERSP